MSAYLIRRRKLGRTSVRKIAEYSSEGILGFRNDKLASPRDSDYIFRWGCTSNVGEGTVVNTAEAIHFVSDKIGFRRAIGELGPVAWTVETDVRYPCVVRPGIHHQGRFLYVANNLEELRSAIVKCKQYKRNHDRTWYASPLINKNAEYRVFIVQGRCVCVAKKHPGNPDQVAWNVAQGGRFDNVRFDEWPLKAVKVSIQAFLKSGLDFGGVDIMTDAEGNCFVLEINAAPSLTSPYRQQCFAKAMDYIVRHGKSTIPLQAEKGGWKKFVHPAISEDARI